MDKIKDVLQQWTVKYLHYLVWFEVEEESVLKYYVHAREKTEWKNNVLTNSRKRLQAKWEKPQTIELNEKRKMWAHLRSYI